MLFMCVQNVLAITSWSPDLLEVFYRRLFFIFAVFGVQKFTFLVFLSRIQPRRNIVGKKAKRAIVLFGLWPVHVINWYYIQNQSLTCERPYMYIGGLRAICCEMVMTDNENIALPLQRVFFFNFLHGGRILLPKYIDNGNLTKPNDLCCALFMCTYNNIRLLEWQFQSDDIISCRFVGNCLSKQETSTMDTMSNVIR